jgi:hypothetical protein
MNSLASVSVNAPLVKDAANSIAIDGRTVGVGAVSRRKIAGLRVGKRTKRQSGKRQSKDSMAHACLTRHA